MDVLVNFHNELVSKFIISSRGDWVKLLHGQVVTVAFSHKLEESRSCELCRITSISNLLFMRNLEMIDGSEETLWPKTDFYLSE